MLLSCPTFSTVSAEAAGPALNAVVVWAGIGSVVGVSPEPRVGCAGASPAEIVSSLPDIEDALPGINSSVSEGRKKAWIHARLGRPFVRTTMRWFELYGQWGTTSPRP